MKEVRHKKTICATVSPYIKNKVEELVANKEFSSMSDLISIAVTDFINRYEMEKKAKGLIRPMTIE